MSELKEVFTYNPAYNSVIRETDFLNVSSAVSLTYTIKCSENCEYGFRWAINSEFDVIEEVNYTLTGGNVSTVFTPVKARYCQFYVKNIAATPCNLQCCGFFDKLIGLEHLQNIGNFAELFNSPNELRTLQSSDGSITITQNGDNIDLVANVVHSSLSTTGTHVSLIENGTAPDLKIKTIQPGPGIEFIATSNNVEISNIGVLSLDHEVPPFVDSFSIIKTATPATGNVKLNWLTNDVTTDGGVIWTENAGYLTAKATLSGISLSSAGGTQTLVTDGTGHTLGIKGLTAGANITLTPTANDITISAGGSNWTVSGSGTTGYVYPTAVIGVVTNVPSNTITAGSTNITLLSSQNTTHKGDQCVSMSCEYQRWQGSGSALRSAAIACASTYIDRNAGVVRYFIQGACDSVSSNSSGGDITTSVVLACSGGGMNRGKESAIFACNNSTMNCSGTADIVMASGSSYIQGASTNSVILAGSSSTITGCNQTVVIGQAVNASGTKSFTCNLGTLSFNTTTANKWNVKAPGGAVFYSDDSATVGVELASGAGSWASVSDMNKKENLVVVDYQEIMDKVDKLNVYSYNYKGNPSAQRCYGTTAQEWHSEDAFKCDDYECDEIDEEGNPVKVMKCGKNCLVIEMQDQIGVLMACIKNLNARVKELESKLI